MNAGAQAARLKKKEPEKLPAWMYRLSLVAVPLATALFFVGTLGLLVLMGAAAATSRCCIHA